MLVLTCFYAFFAPRVANTIWWPTVVIADLAGGLTARDSSKELGRDPVTAQEKVEEETKITTQ